MIKVNNLDLMEPRKAYDLILKEAFHDNSIEFFNSLVKKANIDVEANKETVSKYKKLSAEAKKHRAKESTLKGLRILTIVLLSVLIITGIAFLILGLNKDNPSWMIWTSIPCLLIGIGLIFVVIFKINKDIKYISEKAKEIEGKAAEQKAIAYTQMAGLNSIFDWNMPSRLINKTIPIIEMDDYFDPKRYQLLHDKYGFEDDKSTDTSALYVQSGSILGNPFVIQQNYCQIMKDETYTGHLTIHYTTTEYVNGKMTRVNHTQTLTAHYTAPKPHYFDSTWLILANDAASKLNFSRHPSEANKMNDNQIEKYVKKVDKELDKMVEKSLKKGVPFNRLQNSEFEALFHAFDRDNNMEFRLLFTPLAQTNMVKLIKEKKPFGDDFTFIKRGPLNYISSKHSQTENLYVASPNKFIDFDYENCRQYFIDYFDRYLTNFYFDILPCLSIPLYAQTKTKEYIYEQEYHSNVTSFEAEAAANFHGQELFRPKGSITGVILKSEFANKVNSGDAVNIHSYSFVGHNRVEYVPTMGGDGKFHQVPVEWVEYEQVDAVTPFVVQNAETTQSTFDANKKSDSISQLNANSAILFSKRFVSYVPNGTKTLSDSFLESIKVNKED